MMFITMQMELLQQLKMNMSETQNLKIEAMNIAAGLIRQYKLKDSLVTLSKQIYKFLLEDKENVYVDQ